MGYLIALVMLPFVFMKILLQKFFEMISIFIKYSIILIKQIFVEIPKKIKSFFTNRKMNIVDEIIELELEMFLNVKSDKNRENLQCQKNPEAFKVMRWMNHTVLSKKTLKSYLEDLIAAKKIGRNLMTEKYALMDNIISHQNQNKIIENIAKIETKWMYEIKDIYPKILKENEVDFINYMVSEYETYSTKTINLLMKDVDLALKKEVNLLELRYENLFKRLGYNSLEEAENKMN